MTRPSCSTTKMPRAPRGASACTGMAKLPATRTFRTALSAAPGRARASVTSRTPAARRIALSLCVLAGRSSRRDLAPLLEVAPEARVRLPEGRGLPVCLGGLGVGGGGQLGFGSLLELA